MWSRSVTITASVLVLGYLCLTTGCSPAATSVTVKAVTEGSKNIISKAAASEAGKTLRNFQLQQIRK